MTRQRGVCMGFLSTHICKNANDVAVRHGIALIEITQSRTKFTIGAAELFFMMIISCENKWQDCHWIFHK